MKDKHKDVYMDSAFIAQKACPLGNKAKISLLELEWSSLGGWDVQSI
jgi:hypothetical protein